MELGVPETDILISGDAPDKRHTRGESDFFIEMAREQGWTSAVVLTQPHQLLRAVLGTLKVMELQKYGMEVYGLAPSSTSWFEVVKGSQGMEAKPRFEHIADELNRVSLYQKKGDLVSAHDALSYLRLRELGQLRLGHLDWGSQLYNLSLPDEVSMNQYSI